ncbi:MAG: hypothetical protein MK161_05180 [Pirellulales bacterium]|nr:hypothetical protein [Pirellulales bacterium]
MGSPCPLETAAVSFSAGVSYSAKLCILVDSARLRQRVPVPDGVRTRKIRHPQVEHPTCLAGRSARDLPQTTEKIA